MVKTTPDDEWFELSDNLWLEPGEKRQKVRLLADQNVPQSLVEEIRAHGITVRTAREFGLATLQDAELLSYAKREGLILLTLDDGFWSDKSIRFIRVEASSSSMSAHPRPLRLHWDFRYCSCSPRASAAIGGRDSRRGQRRTNST
jgi:hypothetical protein